MNNLTPSACVSLKSCFKIVRALAVGLTEAPHLRRYLFLQWMGPNRYLFYCCFGRHLKKASQVTILNLVYLVVRSPPEEHRAGCGLFNAGIYDGQH